jgi:uncharacterized protein (DUF983 family)
MMTAPIPKISTLLWRGARRRCPHCGEGDVYVGWVKLHVHCPKCDFKYLADEGDLWAYLVVIDRAVFLFPLVVLIYFRLNNPATLWFYFSSGIVAFGLVYTLPHRNAMGLSLDYWMRRKCGDLAQPNQTPSDAEKNP